MLSTGGIVIQDNKVLMLKTYRNRWVLPKGHIEAGETFSRAALREVFEETGVVAKIDYRIGWLEFYFFSRGRLVNKKVLWYKMHPVGGELKPLKKEGFVDIDYLTLEQVNSFRLHKGEREMIRKVLKD